MVSVMEISGLLLTVEGRLEFDAVIDAWLEEGGLPEYLPAALQSWTVVVTGQVDLDAPIDLMELVMDCPGAEVG